LLEPRHAFIRFQDVVVRSLADPQRRHFQVDCIARHRADRDARWDTIEAPIELARAISVYSTSDTVLLIDCLTLWTANLILGDHDIPGATDALTRSIGHAKGPLILVANEVGYGIVPDNALARRFRDEAGIINQRVAAVVDKVQLIAAGLPLTLK
jgi:adenosylcobinamide kinase/adenosylcobinamide-phosphate guanylyltransferase